MAKAKGHIFSAKTRARHKAMLTPEYFESTILPKIFDHSNISELSNPEIASLKNYVKLQRNKIKSQLATTELSNDVFARGANLVKGRIGNSASEVMKEFMRQKQFFGEVETEKQLRNPNAHPDNKYNYGDAAELMKNEDKWRLLRKLAEIDPRLNIDRAWASETLREIERYIEQGKYSYDDIDSMMTESFTRLTEYNDTWDKNLHGFYRYSTDVDDPTYSEDSIFVETDNWGSVGYVNDQFTANPGFHGRDKAEQNWAYQYRKRARNIDNYEPIWDNPSKFNDFIV